jgi:hypothetical protein
MSDDHPTTPAAPGKPAKPYPAPGPGSSDIGGPLLGLIAGVLGLAGEVWGKHTAGNRAPV